LLLFDKYKFLTLQNTVLTCLVVNRSVYLTLVIGKIIDVARYGTLLLISEFVWMYSILTRYDHIWKKRARGWFGAKTHSTNTTQYVFIIISEYISTIAHARQVCILKVFSDNIGRCVKWRRAFLHIIYSVRTAVYTWK